MSSKQNPLAQLAANNLRVGSVIHKFCHFTTPPKDKFLVVVSVDPRLLVLIINSKINQYYIDNGTDQYHVSVPQVDHQFLSHDSFTNCVEAHTAFDCDDIKQDIIDNYTSVFKGWLTDNCLEDVYNAVKNNNIIRRGHQKEIITAIEGRLTHLCSTLGASPSNDDDDILNQSSSN
ncbi:hypothetical protein AABD46_13460 [Vibrio parahaemolyticus]|uniref:Uncharacterized protein n=1 Tax=Vibrio parahaemolyticus TaxID=670 RepID=A0AAW8Q910_VIBPH|nr:MULTISPECIES: hypothetical protein [Vibrio]HDY8137073.1 hypothetical protein [Vibrio vulnificus]MBE4309542.1 hypothetical protein [Vibrio parahaemolyticus]MCZ5870897.1 hypothetical protein [Vibrio parahaemolyticus]MCZ5901230.1 hypothetical protein [Vibrio parahaemolyticus]MCZ6023801.1 hypothetical protein [Vibrio parahaemolyticus]